MDYKDMSIEDIKLHLLSGDGIALDNLIINQYTIREIKDYGYTNYMMNLQWLSLTVEDFIKSTKDLENRIQLEIAKSELKPFDFYTKLSNSEDMLQGLLIALAMVFKTSDVRYLHTKGIVAIDFIESGLFVEVDGELHPNQEVAEGVSEDDIKIVHRDNFDEIVEIVKTMNYLKPPVEQKDFNPADDATRKLIEQMEANRKRVEEIKKRENQNNEEKENITISDIVSAVTVKSNSVNKFNVWDLSIYQLYDEYARLELIDNYDFSIRAMMAGAEKVDLKHWSSPI